MALLKQNITALYLIKISKWFTLIMPIIVLFYEENGLGLKDIFLLKSVYSIVLVSLDIPTGYLADAWGRVVSSLSEATSVIRYPLLSMHFLLPRSCWE